MNCIDNKYIIYLKKEDIKNINFKNKEEVEELFKKLFLKLKKRYDDINGFFFITVYLNKNITVVELEKEESEYEYLSSKIDMQIEVLEDSIILKEYNNINYIKSNTFYLYNNKYYTKYKDDKDIEFFNIIYGEEVEEILYNSSVCHLKKGMV